jgi:hypothetical protein
MKLQSLNKNYKDIRKLKSQESKLDPEFKKWLDEFTSEHEDVLRKLASK